MATKSAFALTELLVAIAIVIVLAVLLLPSIQRVQQITRTTQCLSNLRQIGLALPAYLAENNGAYPKQASGNVSPGAGATWWECVAPYAGWKDMRPSVTIATRTFMHCPNHTEYPGAFSYFVNNYIVRKPEQSAVTQATILSPSRKILIYEVHTDCRWPQVGNAGAGIGKRPFAPAYAYPTHGKAFNHLFVDGHAESSEEKLSSTITWWDPFNP